MTNDINIYEDASFIDYYKNINTNEIHTFIYPEESTKIVQVKYGPDNRNVEIGFSYNEGYYYSNIDVEAKKLWSSDNYIYCVIPKECTLDVVGSECELMYLKGE